MHINDYGEHGNVPYLVMDYLPGGTLKERMKGKPMPWQEAVRSLIPIASALDFAHEQKVIHRDVKPANILLTAKGQPMLGDFGIAKILELDEGHTLTGTGMGVGTPEYMSPEQGLGKEVDGRADIYSMGIIFYELITGRKPYSADTPMAVILKHTTDPLPRPRQFLPNLPDAVERVVLKALAKDPADRYLDAGAFANAMENLISSSQTHTVSNEQSDDSLETMDTFATNVQIAPESGLRNQAPASVKNGNITSTNLPQKKSNLALWIGLGVTGIVLASALFGWLARGGIATVLPTSTPAFTPTVTLTQTPSATNTAIATNTPKSTNTPQATATPKFTIGSTITGKDGMTLMYVPEGEFTMGSDTGFLPEKPAHTIYLDAFWIDQTEVTNEQYANCVSNGGCTPPSYVSSNSRDSYYGNSQFNDYPVIHVNWNQAKAYCEWAGRRLPTEAEWEKAARGIDERTYPWGNTPPNENLLNFNNNIDDTTPVGNYPSGISPYGAYDMAGNVYEWVADWYAESYYEDSSTSNPLGPNLGQSRVIRGGLWGRVGYNNVHSAFRYHAGLSYFNSILGFRCARSR